MGNCCTADSAVQQESYEEFKKADANKDNLLSKDELRTYIDSHAELWAMLGVNLGLEDQKCREIATHVAYSLAVGGGDGGGTKNKKKNNDKNKTKNGKTQNGKNNSNGNNGSKNQEQPRTLNRKEFHEFREKYVVNPQGNQEFFHRTVFAAYDTDKNGVLDTNELDNFLDIFYKDDSIFAGDKRLPQNKRRLRTIVLEKLDSNQTGTLTFEEIRGLLSGNIELLGLTEEDKAVKAKRTSDMHRKHPVAKKKKHPPSGGGGGGGGAPASPKKHPPKHAPKHPGKHAPKKQKKA